VAGFRDETWLGRAIRLATSRASIVAKLWNSYQNCGSALKRQNWWGYATTLCRRPYKKWSCRLLDRKSVV
jgi:hypothetical protein